MPKLINAEKLAEYKANYCVPLSEWQQGWNDAIDVIMGEEPTVDAIPIEWINKWVNNYCDRYQEKLIECLLRTWKKETEPVRYGHWVYAYRYAMDGTGHWYRECSECEYERDDDNIDKDIEFCPNCGAKMNGGKDDAIND